MIEAGEPLGTRYVVVRPVAELRAGLLFEVVDRSGLQFYGQLLHGEAVAPALASEVRQSVVALPALPALLKPRDVALTSRAVPVALLERPGGVAPASSRLAGAVETLGRREATLWLFRQVAAVAADLAQVHQLGPVHGAITAASLVCAAEGEPGNLQLAGFGINPFARGNDPQKVPTRRADLVDLLNALHELFKSAGLEPEGAAAAKWMLLRASAQHGEHPALASGTALATALNEMASLRPDDAPARPTRNSTVSAPRQSTAPGSAAGRSSAAPRKSAPPGAPGARKTAPGAAPPPAETPAPTRPRVRLGVVIPGILVITAAVAGAVWYALHAGDDIGVARLDQARHPPGAAPAGACEGESTARPEGLTDFRGAEFDAVCAPSPDRVVLVARKGTEVLLTARPAQRGGRYEEPRSLARGAVELGTTLARDGAVWAAWRNGVGDPFGIVRVEGDRVAAVSVPLPGWDSVPLRGAWLLDVGPRGAWVVTDVVTEGGAHSILLQVAFGAQAPEVTAWLLGPGLAEAAIPGASPAVLLRQRLPGEPARHEVTDVTLNLAAIAGARRPAEPTEVRGAPLPESAVTRSTPQVLDGAVLGVVRRGAAAGNAHAWLLARGAVRPADTCEVPERCHTAGPVTLLTFAPGAAPVVTPVSPSGWATDLAPSGGGLSALVTTANVAGAEVPFHTLVPIAPTRLTPTGEQAGVATLRSPRARIVACGSEAWVAFDAAQPAPVLSTLPLACVRAR